MLRHGTNESERNIFRLPKIYLTSCDSRLKCSDEIIKSKSLKKLLPATFNENGKECKLESFFFPVESD